MRKAIFTRTLISVLAFLCHCFPCLFWTSSLIFSTGLAKNHGKSQRNKCSKSLAMHLYVLFSLISSHRIIECSLGIFALASLMSSSDELNWAMNSSFRRIHGIAWTKFVHNLPFFHKQSLVIGRMLESFYFRVSSQPNTIAHVGHFICLNIKQTHTICYYLVSSLHLIRRILAYSSIQPKWV